MLARASTDLFASLPPTRGEISINASLAGITWFRTGGTAEVLFLPADTDDLKSFIESLDKEIDITVLGLGSNALIRDGGVPGVVIHLGKNFGEVTFDGDDVIAGAGALDVTVSRSCHERRLAGLEFLNGIPGMIGGALRMNAGAYGSEISDVLISAEAMDSSGKIRKLSKSDFGFSYRRCSVDEDWIFLSARLRGVPSDHAAIAKRMSQIKASRKSTQPIQERTGGSTFKNPPDSPAWELIDAAGCRGLVVGDAMVSEQHCNFLINRGNATAADLECLGEEVRQRVRAHSGILLEWEIRLIGIPAKDAS
ncbi:MAG: UDP-N-acetylenolpyruvoylglucosamine reductase [Alphaproteobacteria bacterium MarineAlpha11_Bin1]|mgnify:CR=1 FL=1|nr:MAG: UDP-N-acetylenolpyruvoylglucosamine reductase [Alphaproteobacteria bacterium MarineAlpha11_Bin1]|tara:strand:+ start:4479 stop:5405 length:927 start_codon:yes stop_codon:yes gene_type:complete